MFVNEVQMLAGGKKRKQWRGVADAGLLAFRFGPPIHLSINVHLRISSSHHEQPREWVPFIISYTSRS